MDAVLTWLLQQAPVVVVMGIVIWWLAKQLLVKDKLVSELSREVIKLTTLWEEKSEQLSDNTSVGYLEIIRILKEIRSLLINRNNRVGKFGRLLGAVFFGGMNINKASIRAGKATPFERRNEGKIPNLNKELLIEKWL